MSGLILFFALGIWYCQNQASTPHAGNWFAVALLSAAVAVLFKRHAWFWLRRIGWLALALSVGALYAGWRGEARLADELPLALEGRDVEVIAVIADLPQRSELGVRFTLSVLKSDVVLPRKLLVSWYAPRAANGEPVPALAAGQRWRMVLRLRRPHGSMNPHGFDYEALQFERGIRAVGYVRGAGNQLLEAKEPGIFYAVQRMREGVRERFARALVDTPWRGVLVALAIGDQASVSADQWRLFSHTGVTHLMSISGLHVTSIAALFGWFVGWSWRRSSYLCLRLPAQKAAIAAGLCSAAVYVVLAGFGIPAQRTLYMLACVAVAIWCGRASQALQALAAALLIVVLIDPWAVRSVGFWLSFAAVSALMLALAHERGKPHIVKAWLRAQWAILLVSVPLLLGLLHHFSVISPLANLLAIPLISAVITPLALLFAVFPLPLLADLAHALLSFLMYALSSAASLPWAVWHQAAPPFWLVAAAVAAGAWALLPRGVPARWTGLLICLPLLFWSPPRPASGHFKMTVIDVGQGLAVHVQTARHDLLYDAGPRYAESDSGERVVVPYLRAQGVTRLHGMLISHDDNDHSGGAESVLAAMPVERFLSTLPATHPLSAKGLPCRAGQQWVWDQVRFEVIYPTDDLMATKDNDRSCVLKVQGVKGSALLPGDIEAAAESMLLAERASDLRADVLIAPHHGSRSSSTAAFVAAVQPSEVVFTAGYRNRFRHPHPQVVQRYADAGARRWRSDSDGAVIMQTTESGILVTTERSTRARYWHGR